ncbi:hypothetical protein CNR22_13650 [Sphingobacteriaceae bacterium]|nr:hypothetical protein CNR22_13650 [Sphingobacteriaceae bacterium]
MKNYFILLVSAVCISSAAIAQIPNAGFETWTNMGTYENPNGWSTLNTKTTTQSIYTATKGTPGSPGNSYLKLTSKTIGLSVVPGIAVSGKLDSMSMQPISGVPYTQRPASFTGKWQHMIYGSSQGSLMVLLTRWNATTSMRDTIAHGLRGLSGMAMSWANFSFALNYMDSLNYPDSCIIVLRASGSNPANNDYLWTDNLAFTGTVAVVQPTVNTTGLNENTKKNLALTLYPNPAQDHVTVNYSINSAQEVSVQIIDVSGKVVKDMHAPNAIGLNVLTIETTKLAKGVYTLKLKTDTTVTSTNLVIQ